MKDPNTGEEILDIEIDDLFKIPDETPSSEDDPNLKPKTPEEKKAEFTQAVTKRINEVKTKTEKETLEKVAKDLGFESYAAMEKSKQDEIIKKQGYNPEDLEKVIEPLVQKRLADDPRLKELETFKAHERDQYVQSQLKAINEATGQTLTVKDLPKETLDLWAKGVDLEQAYYATQGKQLITKAKNQVNNGSLDHLALGSGAQQPKMRRLTESEKDMYRAIAPHLTEEELNKKTIEVQK